MPGWRASGYAPALDVGLTDYLGRLLVWVFSMKVTDSQTLSALVMRLVGRCRRLGSTDRQATQLARRCFSRPCASRIEVSRYRSAIHTVLGWTKTAERSSPVANRQIAFTQPLVTGYVTVFTEKVIALEVELMALTLSNE